MLLRTVPGARVVSSRFFRVVDVDTGHNGFKHHAPYSFTLVLAYMQRTVFQVSRVWPRDVVTRTFERDFR